MKMIMVVYLYLLMIKSQALDCKFQCPKMREQDLEFLVVPSNNFVEGDTACICCRSKRPDNYIHIHKNQESVCPFNRATSDYDRNYICKVNDTYALLKIFNLTYRESDLWKCSTRYDQSNPVNITVIGKSTYPSTLTSLLSVSTSLRLQTSTDITEIKPPTTSDAKTDTTIQGQQTYYITAVIVVVVVFSIILGVSITMACRKAKWKPYDQMERRLSRHSRNDANERFYAEEILQMGTPDADDSSYYRSLNRFRYGTHSGDPGGDTGGGVVTLGGVTVEGGLNAEGSFTVAKGGIGKGEGGAVKRVTGGADIVEGAISGMPRHLSRVEKNVMSILATNIHTILQTVETSSCSRSNIDESISNEDEDDNEKVFASRNIDKQEPDSTNKEEDGSSNDEYQIIDDEDKESPPSQSASVTSDDLTDVSSKSSTGDLDNAYLHPILESH